MILVAEVSLRFVWREYSGIEEAALDAFMPDDGLVFTGLNYLFPRRLFRCQSSLVRPHEHRGLSSSVQRTANRMLFNP